MRTSFSISFYCRNSMKRKCGLAPIEVSIVYNGERWILALPRKEDPAVFEKEMYSRKQNPTKDYTSAVTAKIRSFQTQLLLENRPFTRETLKEFIYFGFSDNHYTMGFLFEVFLESQMKKVGAKLSTQPNYRKYEIVRDLVFGHGCIRKDMHLTSIRQKHIVDFNTYLLSRYDSTTVAGMMQKLKSVFLYALRNKMITENPFFGFTITRKQKEVQFLTQEEVARIKDAVMPTGRMEVYRDLFVFQCYTALSFVDMENLMEEDFKKNEYGYVYVEKERAKTGVKFCAILFEDAIRIAEKYGFRLPAVHCQNYNGGLKVIADICGITKPMHSHIGRHTAACYLLNEKHLSLDVVARILGHSTTKITRHYAKLSDNTVFDAIKYAESKLKR